MPTTLGSLKVTGTATLATLVATAVTLTTVAITTGTFTTANITTANITTANAQTISGASINSQQANGLIRGKTVSGSNLKLNGTQSQGVLCHQTGGTIGACSTSINALGDCTCGTL